MRRRFGFTLIEALVVLAIVAILAAVLIPGCVGGSQQNSGPAAPSAGFGRSTAVVTIEQKEVVKGESGKEYYFYTAEDGLFVSEDDLFKGKFGSSDLYYQLKIGRKYEIEYTGWRNAAWKQYPNILRIVREVNDGE